ncbi:unnamed protein product, partial [Prorocentrum cordatum]
AASTYRRRMIVQASFLGLHQDIDWDSSRVSCITAGELERLAGEKQRRSQHEAAVRIQRSWREFSARARALLSALKAEQQASAVIGRSWRERRRRRRDRRFDAAARSIQGVVRCWLARRRLLVQRTLAQMRNPGPGTAELADGPGTAASLDRSGCDGEEGEQQQE